MEDYTLPWWWWPVLVVGILVIIKLLMAIQREDLRERLMEDSKMRDQEVVPEPQRVMCSFCDGRGEVRRVQPEDTHPARVVWDDCPWCAGVGSFRDRRR